MLNTLPEALHRETLDRFSSPRSRQNWAQVSRETRRVTRESDAAYYEKWLEQDFPDASRTEASPPAKKIYQQHIEASRLETSQLLRLAQGGDRRKFIADVTNPSVANRLSKRYGKLPVADAGLAMVQGLAQPRSPDASPPRLRAGELAALAQATRTIRALAAPRTEENKSSSFERNLRDAEQQAESQVTLATQPAGAAPLAPKRVQSLNELR